MVDSAGWDRRAREEAVRAEGLEEPLGVKDQYGAVASTHSSAPIGTPLEHIAGALWTSTDFCGLSGLARLPHLQGNRGIREAYALNS